MLNMVQVIALIGIGAVIAILGGLCGAYLMWKGSRAVPGEKFLGGVPKGEVFSIPGIEDELEPDPQENKVIVERLNKFINQFNGGKE